MNRQSQRVIWSRDLDWYQIDAKDILSLIDAGDSEATVRQAVEEIVDEYEGTASFGSVRSGERQHAYRMLQRYKKFLDGEWDLETLRKKLDWIVRRGD